jgi:hypothetical protein
MAVRASQFESNAAKLNQLVKIEEKSQALSPLHQFLSGTHLRAHLDQQAKLALIQKAQLQWVSQIPLPTLEHTLMALEMERFLAAAVPKQGGWSLNDYCWTENFDSASLVQVTVIDLDY